MDRLPLEICSSVVDYLILLEFESQEDDDPISRYAFISQNWQAAVEYHTFSELRISVPDDLETFRALFDGINARRRHFLKKISVEFVLPDERTDICCMAGRSRDRHADSQSISQSMTKLFSTISDISSRAGHGTRPMTLELRDTSRHSETDPKFSKLLNRRHCYARGHREEDMDLARIRAPLYELLEVKSIPELSQIAKLIFLPRSDLARLHPNWVPKLISRLPSLEDLELNFHDDYEWGQGIRVQKRNALAENILSTPLSSLKNLTLRTYHLPVPNENSALHVLTKSDSEDPYRRALTHLSQLSALTTLCLTGPLVVRSDFFATLQKDCFVALTYFHLDFAAETADGRWFFERDREAFEKDNPRSSEVYHGLYDDDHHRYWDDTESPDESGNESEEEEEDGSGPELGCYSDTNSVSRYRTNRFRTVPVPNKIEPLLQQAADAAKGMKNLKKLVIQERSHWIEGQDIGVSFPFVSRVFGLWYFTRGTPFRTIYEYPQIPGDAEFVDQDRIYWRVGNWKPSDETQKAWIMGSTDYKVTFLEEDCWDLNKGRDKPVYAGQL